MILELERFLLVAKEGSITRTAEKIYITQSALTQSIQRLEKEVGARLFKQNGKQIVLTEEGKSLVTIGEKILQLWNNAKQTSVLQSRLSQYSIGMFDNAALHLSQFLQKYMNSGAYNLELTIDGSTNLHIQLKLGTLDAAICVLNKKMKLPNTIMLLETFIEELIPVSSKKFTGKLDSIPFIFYQRNSSTREQIDSIFAEKNITPTIFVESTSTTFMKELALSGNGVALLPKNGVRSEMQQKTLFKQNLNMRWQRIYGIYINTQSDLHKDHPLIKELLQALQKKKK